MERVGNDEFTHSQASDGEAVDGCGFQFRFAYDYLPNDEAADGEGAQGEGTDRESAEGVGANRGTPDTELPQSFVMGITLAHLPLAGGK